MVVIACLRSFGGLVVSVPDLLFATIPAGGDGSGRGHVGRVLGCRFLRFSKALPAVFVATLLITLGISLLGGRNDAAKSLSGPAKAATVTPLVFGACDRKADCACAGQERGCGAGAEDARLSQLDRWQGRSSGVRSARRRRTRGR